MIPRSLSKDCCWLHTFCSRSLSGWSKPDHSKPVMRSRASCFIVWKSCCQTEATVRRTCAPRQGSSLWSSGRESRSIACSQELPDRRTPHKWTRIQGLWLVRKSYSRPNTFASSRSHSDRKSDLRHYQWDIATADIYA